jgi:hypothetical protein
MLIKFFVEDRERPQTYLFGPEEHWGLFSLNAKKVL